MCAIFTLLFIFYRLTMYYLKYIQTIHPWPFTFFIDPAPFWLTPRPCHLLKVSPLSVLVLSPRPSLPMSVAEFNAGKRVSLWAQGGRRSEDFQGLQQETNRQTNKRTNKRPSRRLLRRQPVCRMQTPPLSRSRASVVHGGKRQFAKLQCSAF